MAVTVSFPPALIISTITTDGPPALNFLSVKNLYDLIGAKGIHNQRSTIHKYFKIMGFIGEVGQSGKLSYIGLLKQIEGGTERGYSDREIVNVVLRAITPGLYLRNVLETTEELTLGRLMKFQQSHFVEQHTTDHCQHLSLSPRAHRNDQRNLFIVP